MINKCYKYSFAEFSTNNSITIAYYFTIDHLVENVGLVITSTDVCSYDIKTTVIPLIIYS